MLISANQDVLQFTGSHNGTERKKEFDQTDFFAKDMRMMALR
jgi:hypothetical protein